MGGKGYKPRTDLSGRRVSGDWEDSDRGEGNKSKRRSGLSVKVKSPSYLAHVHNKGKKTIDPKKNPVVASYQPEGDVIGELNRYEKETGKSSGRESGRSDINTPRKGTSTKTKEKPTAVSVVKSKTIRPMTGRPQGQKKSDYADRHKEQNRKETPARTMEKRRYDPRDEVEKATDGRYSKNQRYD